jgi:hypothetical protein
MKSASFVDDMSKEFICLAATALHHGLSAWKTGVFITPPEFTRLNVFGGP